jgi:8-oxo-dGTP pyrophosphatase MutT (NUDIX family)
VDVITGSISCYVFTMVRGRPQFLLLLRAEDLLHGGTWQAVHGMIEPGETAVAAARREMTEETGLEPARFLKTDYVESFYSEHTDAIHLVPAFAGFVEDTGVTLSVEHTKYEWCSHDDARSRLVWPSQRDAVGVIAAGVSEWPELGVGLTELSS